MSFSICIQFIVIYLEIRIFFKQISYKLNPHSCIINNNCLPENLLNHNTDTDLSDLDEEITFVEKDTPCGELLRRYWHPVLLSEELGDLPKLIKVLGEELVLFRDKSGQIGLLHKHCAHRGASLEYGIVADCGLICSYHAVSYTHLTLPTKA